MAGDAPTHRAGAGWAGILRPSKGRSFAEHVKGGGGYGDGNGDGDGGGYGARPTGLQRMGRCAREGVDL